MLVEVDHVLKFVNERHRHELLDVGGGVRAAQRTGRVGHDRVEDLRLVGARVISECRIQIGAEEEAGNETGTVALGGRHELVHRVGHQYHHDRIGIDVRLAAERSRIDRVQPLIEQIGDAVERQGVESAGGRQRIHVDSHFGLERAHARADAIELRAIGLGAHLKYAQRAHPRRPGRDRQLRLRLRCRTSLFRHQSPGAPLVTQSQVRVKPLGGTQIHEVRRHRRRGPGRGKNRVSHQPELGELAGNAGAELRNDEILGRTERGRKHHAPAIDNRVDRSVLVDCECDGVVGRRTGTEMRLGAATARDPRHYRQEQKVSQVLHEPPL